MRIVYITILLALLWLLSTRVTQATLDCLPPAKEVHSRVIISLTTLPSRVRKIRPTLYSLLDQTVPAQIEIHIPSRARPEPDQPYAFPAEIRNHPQIRIITDGEDLGPSMKFIPAIKAHTGESILVVDDDIIYSKDLVEKMLRAQSSNDEVIWCTRGNIFQEEANYRDLHTVHSEQVTVPLRVSIVTGCGSYLLSPKVTAQLRGIIDDYSQAPSETTLMDDVWISGVASRQKIPKYLVPGIKKYHTNLGAMLFTPAHLNSARAEKNEIAIQYFQKDWLPEEIV